MGDVSLFYGNHPWQGDWCIGTTQLAVGFVAGWWFGGGSEEPCYPDQKFTLRTVYPPVNRHGVQRPRVKPRYGTGVGNLLASRTEPHSRMKSSGEMEWWLVSHAGDSAWVLLCNAVASETRLLPHPSRLIILRRDLVRHAMRRRAAVECNNTRVKSTRTISLASFRLLAPEPPLDYPEINLCSSHQEFGRLFA